MFNLSKYTKIERKAFLATCLFLLVFWTVVMASDGAIISVFISSPEKTSMETFCLKKENMKRKHCLERQMKNKEKWEDISRNANSKKTPTIFGF
jgi:hypothetical protein